MLETFGLPVIVNYHQAKDLVACNSLRGYDSQVDNCKATDWVRDCWSYAHTAEKLLTLIKDLIKL